MMRNLSPIRSASGRENTEAMMDNNANTVSSVPDLAAIQVALQRASRAPSIHNTQPWHWEFDGAQLCLYRDKDRLLASADPTGRQLVISCGAMLHHLRTVLTAGGWHTDLERIPDTGRPDLLGRLAFRPWLDPPKGVVARAAAIATRRTDRLPLAAPVGFEEVMRSARMLASPLEIELDLLDDSARPLLAQASREASAKRRYDMDYQAELHWWAGHSPDREGVPRTSLPSDAEAAHVPVARKFPSAPHSQRRGDIEDEAKLVVLSSSGNSMADWLHAGEALSAVLLECTRAGFATCALTHITELVSARKAIEGLTVCHGVPQVLIRVGAAPTDLAPPPTPRRPVSEILSVLQ
ncbi:hypothetical protein GV794_05185 [Nocardia cyriacigeorgica]|uniref:NAD(P)H nitroreductase RV3131/MT3217 n=3 Tax=Nocardia cyriacigeorgica TaxID=135487 RepID=A0A6P1CZ05_9NOCA|nr:hypothetical protein [Nocardia cyriacigeorgica]NEW37655.1 hypothetical protein [Nocardia cyriacigeorgica]NEW43247.1 hypothetical protein [Nocardia cyriacigeorgica]NEW48958.1 hypothetical protein [Nocardia cyriacigeorgica]NEW55059.1 hypothetical protein [Nocardia cyriacigeorgica]